MDSSDIITQFISSLDASLDDLEPSIKQLIGQSFQDKINTTSAPIDRIKIANGYAYILTSLCFTYLKSQGVDVNKHPIIQDLNRIKSYMKRATEVAKPKTKVNADTGAAKRFIQAALNSGTGNSTVINGIPQPAISSVSFEGKHTKFEQDNEEKDLTKQIGDKLRGQLKEKKEKKEKKSRIEKITKSKKKSKKD